MDKWKKLGLNILVDVLGGILIALGTYNFAAASRFPMVGLNGVALIFYHLFDKIGIFPLLLPVFGFWGGIFFCVLCGPY